MAWGLIDHLTSKVTVEGAWDNCLDIASFAGVGYLSGRSVNWLTKWTSKPSLFNKSELVDLKSIAICSALFMTIDRLACAVLTYYVNDDQLKKPVYTAIRIAVDLTATVSLFNAVAEPLKQASVEFKTASAIILAACALYAHVLLIMSLFNDQEI